MDQGFVEDVVAANGARAGFGRFLASLFLYELTDEQIEELAHISFERDGSKVAQGCGLRAHVFGRRHVRPHLGTAL